MVIRKHQGRHHQEQDQIGKIILVVIVYKVDHVLLILLDVLRSKDNENQSKEGLHQEKDQHDQVDQAAMNDTRLN
jgi:hypothetical protein